MNNIFTLNPLFSHCHAHVLTLGERSESLSLRLDTRRSQKVPTCATVMTVKRIMSRPTPLDAGSPRQQPGALLCKALTLLDGGLMQVISPQAVSLLDDGLQQHDVCLAHGRVETWIGCCDSGGRHHLLRTGSSAKSCDKWFGVSWTERALGDCDDFLVKFYVRDDRTVGTR